ncbi:pentapeptide repeat-containing protein [Glycomyces mayteni]|uniref:Pentapeptide repeat-containing protein n=1 Tax=Glycomyces mayteni TaxID=543887 RepID=A0ABW2D7Q8_9ACTN|nr:hypothetical protein GCM10025732_30000 [Glycomyces mayteni]
MIVGTVIAAIALLFPLLVAAVVWISVRTGNQGAYRIHSAGKRLLLSMSGSLDTVAYSPPTTRWRTTGNPFGRLLATAASETPVPTREAVPPIPTPPPRLDPEPFSLASKRFEDQSTLPSSLMSAESETEAIAYLESIESLADQDLGFRQTAVNVICDFLRLSSQRPPREASGLIHFDQHDRGGRSDSVSAAAFGQRILEHHLSPRAQSYWGRVDLCLDGAHLADLRLETAVLGKVSFVGTRFIGSTSFAGATFEEPAFFDRAWFKSTANFTGIRFQTTSQFGGARFDGDVRFDGARFEGHANFNDAEFTGARFDGARFGAAAEFVNGTFKGELRFDSASFLEAAAFASAQFHGITRFDSADFNEIAIFSSISASDYVRFDSVAFEDRAIFRGARFEFVVRFDGARFDRDADYSKAFFGGPVQLTHLQVVGDLNFAASQAASSINLDASRFSGRIDFDRSVLEEPPTFGAARVLSPIAYTGPVLNGTFEVDPAGHGWYRFVPGL